MKTFKIIYGIIIPLVCVMMDIELTRLGHHMVGLLLYVSGAFIFYWIWFNFKGFITTMNS